VGVPERIVVQLGAPVVLQTDVVANQDAEMQAARLELTATVNQANAHVKLPVHVPVNISVWVTVMDAPYQRLQHNSKGYNNVET